MTEAPTMPVDVEAERYVLGAVMLSPAALDEVSEILTPAHLYEPRHQSVYAAVRRLHDAGKPTDVVAVGDELLRSKEFVGNLDASYLHALTDNVATAANAAYHAQIVLENATRRHMLDAAARVSALASDRSVDATTAVELAREQLDGIGETTQRAVETIGDWFIGYAQSLTEKPSFTPTPWYDINTLINGFRDGGMYIVAARPGDGKTIIAVQCALAFAEERPVLFVSLEMQREEIAGRMIASRAQIFLGSIAKHALADAEWRAFQAHRGALERLPLAVVGSDEVSSIPELKAKVRAMRRRFKRNPVVIVDYLQLLTSPTHVESRQVEVAGFSRSLKLAAQQWGVPVIALSQLNRGSAQRKSQEPQLSDLRESGAIEQDADVVMLLSRKTNRGVDEMTVNVAKNRQGRTGQASLVWQGQFSRVLSKHDARTQLINEGDFS